MKQNQLSYINTIEMLHTLILDSAGISTKLESVSENKIYFAFTPYVPKSILKKILWKICSLLELYATTVLFVIIKIIYVLCKKTPLHKHIKDLLTQRFDGNSNAPLAIAKGASVAIVDSRRYHGERYVYVPCVKTALRDLAAYHRNYLDLICIGITGSNGKTTTKELIAEVLSESFNVVKTRGNFNTEIGVCHTILSIDRTVQIAVVEIGSDGFNHQIMDRCLIVQPNYGVVTNIGKAHLQGFINLNGVFKIKKQLFDFINNNGGVIFLNTDETMLRDTYNKQENTVTYGTSLSASTCGEIISCDPYLVIRWQIIGEHGETHYDIHTKLFGSYNTANVLAAIAVGSYFGVSHNKIINAIERYQPNNLRSQILKHDGITFIIDTYNANPTSVAMALKDFCSTSYNNKIVILGDMLELGHDSLKEHADILTMLRPSEIKAFYLVGKEFGALRDDRIGFFYDSVDRLIQALDLESLRGSCVFIKGSRGNRLEILLDKLGVNYH